MLQRNSVTPTLAIKLPKMSREWPIKCHNSTICQLSLAMQLTNHMNEVNQSNNLK